MMFGVPQKFPAEKNMENSVRKISKALLDLASVSDAVLHATPKAQGALKSGKLEATQKNLLERIDGFRSIDQLLAMSGDLFGVHAALGTMMAAGLVTSDFKLDSGAEESVLAVTAAPTTVMPAPARTLTPAASPKIATAMPEPKVVPVAKILAPRPPPESPPLSELDNAKQLLLEEAKLALGKGAEKLRTRIDACRSIEEIFDLIVKVQEHLTTSGKADPEIFLDRLTNGLAAARK